MVHIGMGLDVVYSGRIGNARTICVAQTTRRFHAFFVPKNQNVLVVNPVEFLGKTLRQKNLHVQLPNSQGNK